MKAHRTLTAMAALLAAPAAWGQVVRTQHGRALDSNYLLGSGGINSVRRVNYRIDGNYYVTGQVTLGRHFRGTVPYRAASSLGADVPSAGLSDFIRDSIGVDQIRTAYEPSVYLAPSRTVLGPGAIDRGQTAPGTTIPRRAFVPPDVSRRLYEAAVEDFRPMLPDMGRLLQVDARVRSTPVTAAPPGAAGEPEGADYGAIRPTASTLFGVLRRPEREQLAEEMSEADWRRLARQVGSPVEAAVPARVEGRPRETEPTGRSEGPPPTAPDAAERGLPEPGQDVYMDLLQVLDRIRKQVADEAEREPEGPTEGPAKTPEATEPTEPVEPPTALRPMGRTVGRVGDRPVLYRLAGNSTDLFNLHMKRAEKLLKEGKYYSAAQRYRMASLYDPKNPLAVLGSSLALFAAHEPLSSALQLRRALTRFPPLMQARVDVHGMIDKATLARRLSELEARIAEGGKQADPALVFVAAFVRWAAGDEAKARELAGLLKSRAGDEKLYSVYAEYLLTGKLPGPAPTTAPAAAGSGRGG